MVRAELQEQVVRMVVQVLAVLQEQMVRVELQEQVVQMVVQELQV